MLEEQFYTEKTIFAKTRYFSGEIRKNSFIGAKELQARSGIYSGVLGNLFLIAFFNLFIISKIWFLFRVK